MKKCVLYPSLVVVFALAGQVLGQIPNIEISVTTDKTQYLLNEDVIITVIATNPNPDPITLSLGLGPTVSYLMDDLFDWKAYHTGLPALADVVFDPFQSRSWQLVHGPDERNIHPLNMGVHSVKGELIGYGFSEPFGFEVIPEPASLIVFAAGALIMRRRTAFRKTV